MRIFKSVIVISILFFFSAAQSPHAADIAKIGIVDFQKILKVSSAGKMSQTEFRTRGQQMEDDLNKKGREIDEMKKKLEGEALVMNREMRESKERDIRIAIGDFKELEQKFRNEFRAFNEQLVSRLKKDVLELVLEIGKKEGYLMIIEKNDGGVLYSPNSIDITDKLIEKYNAVFAVSNKKGK
ncbi:MAG: OmpH family outer membrane protein [Desulfobacterales bacterium]|nr:OmpH family outer membrane protein [Desulfobacterales bacterium]